MGSKVPGGEPGTPHLGLTPVAEQRPLVSARHVVIHVGTAHMFQRDVWVAVRLEQRDKVTAGGAVSEFHGNPFSE